MEIIRLEGTDRKLYEWVAPLVMNPAILRQNNNYPFKTSHRHVWYLAVEGLHVLPPEHLARGHPARLLGGGGVITFCPSFHPI